MTEEWHTLLESDSKGVIISSMKNFTLIIENDPQLANIVYNEMTKNIDIIGEVPWNNSDHRGWNSNDFSCLEVYLEKTYRLYAPTKCKDALYAFVSTHRRHHPIKAYLEGLKWDKVERLDRLLISFFNAEDNEYTKMVTRKTLVAAITRLYNPGIKYDYVLVLCGDQGIGKSTLFSKLGKNWYSDAMNISDMKDKTACEKMQGVWIMELGELAGLKKMDVEIVKSFISRQNDKYRPAYGLYVEDHPRSGIIVGTTNSRNGFLRDVTGNRRFWPVMVYKGEKKIWDIESRIVDQIWAEAYQRYLAHEPLYLNVKDEIQAAERQRISMEQDPRTGIVEDYLERTNPTRLCLMQIWCECLGKKREDMMRNDAYELEAILTQIGGWEVYSKNASGKTRIENYGVQKTYVRKDGEKNGQV